jgi:XTP/dITP diphosphohydrolase
MQLVFASHNKNKIKEISELIPASIYLKGLSDIGCNEEIPETADTIEGNAVLKAKFVCDNYHLNCFADDSGLEVEALRGEPGVYSARYAGEPKNDENNIQKLLKNLKAFDNRNAQFKTVIALIMDGKEQLFEGIIKGKISSEKRGKNGFGYDPIFIPDGYDKTFAEMDLSEKNKISHRAIAVKKLIEFLISKHR